MAQGAPQAIALAIGLCLLIVSSRATVTSPTSNVTTSIIEASKTIEEPITIESKSVSGKDISAEKPAVQIVTAKTAPGWRGSEKAPSPGDSYIQALRLSRYSPDNRDKIVRMDTSPVSSNRREYSPGPVYVPQTAYGTVNEPVESYHSDKSSKSSHHGAYSPPDHNRDSFSITPSDSYSLPSRPSIDFQNRPPTSLRSSYDSPRIVYGPPHKQHHKNPYGDYAGNSYPPVQPAYGSHSPSPSYGHNVPYGLPEVHVSELPSIDFSWPFALKLNIFTLAKIILKLVIFKMIVKFIAIICLLLFIPKLKLLKKGNKNQMADDDDEEDEGRRFLPDNFISRNRLNALTALVLSSVEDYESRNEGRSNSESCTDLSCHLRGSLAVNNSWSDYGRLLRSYVAEEMNRTNS